MSPTFSGPMAEFIRADAAERFGPAGLPRFRAMIRRHAAFLERVLSAPAADHRCPLAESRFASCLTRRGVFRRVAPGVYRVRDAAGCRSVLTALQRILTALTPTAP